MKEAILVFIGIVIVIFSLVMLWRPQINKYVAPAIQTTVPVQNTIPAQNVPQNQSFPQSGPVNP